jgi:molybdenum cofactor cytidylyltransferase
MAEASEIAAILLAAGSSTRMGHPKLILNWKDTTILGKVVSTLANAGIPDIIVITGAVREQLARHVEQLSTDYPVRTVHNPAFLVGEMLSSVQTGLKTLQPATKAVLITLGDQPQIQENTILSILSAYQHSRSALVIPSYRMHRGHPWLVSRELWPQLLDLNHPQTLRGFLEGHASEIDYVTVDNDSILQDIDTPEDYTFHKPD